MQALQQGVQRAEGTSQLQDWNMERNDLEARRQTGELENNMYIRKQILIAFTFVGPCTVIVCQ